MADVREYLMAFGAQVTIVRSMNGFDEVLICIDKKFPQALAKNLVFPDWCKHINTRYHFIRECVAKKEVELKYVMTQDEVANIFTEIWRFSNTESKTWNEEKISN